VTKIELNTRELQEAVRKIKKIILGLDRRKVRHLPPTNLLLLFLRYMYVLHIVVAPCFMTSHARCLLVIAQPDAQLSVLAHLVIVLKAYTIFFCGRLI